MPFIIQRQRADGRAEYVAPAGSKKSFTPYRCRAQRYLTHAQAEADVCPENETIRTL